VLWGLCSSRGWLVTRNSVHTTRARAETRVALLKPRGVLEQSARFGAGGEEQHGVVGAAKQVKRSGVTPAPITSPSRALPVP
jgi:hypothetical protein